MSRTMNDAAVRASMSTQQQFPRTQQDFRQGKNNNKMKRQTFAIGYKSVEVDYLDP